MYKSRRIAAVVPAHNEEAHIADVVATMPEFVDLIIVVDDCSTDRTSEAAAGTGDERVHVVRHEQNQGVGGSILTGHLHAMERGADIDVVMAGDGQMDPAFLPDLLDPLVDGHYGFSKANRFFAIDSFSGMPRVRIFGNIVLSFLIKLASGYWYLFDPENGYTAITRQALSRLSFNRISHRYEFEADLLINLNILRVPARDVPIPARYGNEVSGIRLRKVIPSTSRLIFVGFWKRILLKYVLGSFSPIALFLFTGLALTAWGVIFGILVLLGAFGSGPPTAGTVMLSVAPFLIGVQLLIFAIVLDIQESPDRPEADLWWRSRP